MDARADVWVIYFPPDVEVASDRVIKGQPASGFRGWQCLKYFQKTLDQLGNAFVPFTWTYIMSKRFSSTAMLRGYSMTERLLINGMDRRAEEDHLKHLENIDNGRAVADMIKDKDSCLAGLFHKALDVQRLLAGKLMSLDRFLLTASLPNLP
jgi:hypothetical protein